MKTSYLIVFWIHAHICRIQEVNHLRYHAVKSPLNSPLFEAEILKGHYIKVNKNTTLRDFYKDWLEKYAKDKYSPKTFQNYTNDINARVLPIYGHMKLADIQPIHVVNFMDKLKKDGQRLDGMPGKLSSSSISNVFKAFNSILACAVEWKYITENPATPAKPKKPKYKKSEVYSQQEVDIILDHLWL